MYTYKKMLIQLHLYSSYSQLYQFYHNITVASSIWFRARDREQSSHILEFHVLLVFIALIQISYQQ